MSLRGRDKLGLFMAGYLLFVNTALLILLIHDIQYGFGHLHKPISAGSLIFRSANIIWLYLMTAIILRGIHYGHFVTLWIEHWYASSQYRKTNLSALDPNVIDHGTWDYFKFWKWDMHKIVAVRYRSVVDDIYARYTCHRPKGLFRRMFMAKSYPASEAVKTWKDGDLTYYITVTKLGHYCGYVHFPKRPLDGTGQVTNPLSKKKKTLHYMGIVTFVPVHGGVTYAEPDCKGGITYGFDCAHAGDDQDRKTRDRVWVEQECRRMAMGIKEAAKFEERFKAQKSFHDKLGIVNEYHDQLREIGIDFVLTDNFGSMMEFLAQGLLGEDTE